MRLLLPLSVLPVALLAQTTVPPDPLDALVRDSPFLPPAGAGPGNAATATGPLEFRSVIFEGGRFVFSVYDQGSRKSHWISLGQEDAPIVARSYDREQDVLTVEHQGRSLALKLQAGHVEGQPPAGGAPTPLPSAAETTNQPQPPPNQAPAPANAAPAPAVNPSENQRLQELADELRRRRQAPVQAPAN